MTSIARPLLKLISFDHKGIRKVGSLLNGEVVDLTSSMGALDMKSFLMGGDKTLRSAEEVIKSGKNRLRLDSSVKIKAPMYLLCMIVLLL